MSGASTVQSCMQLLTNEGGFLLFFFLTKVHAHESKHLLIHAYNLTFVSRRILFIYI